MRAAGTSAVSSSSWRVEPRLSRGPRAARDEREAAVGLERRVRLEREERLEALRLVARLLEELAARGLLGRLAGVDHAAGDLERQRVGAEAVLPDEDDAIVGRHRDDVAPVGEAQREGVAARAAGGVGEVDALHLEDAKATDRLAAQRAPLLEPRGAAKDSICDVLPTLSEAPPWIKEAPRFVSDSRLRR